MDETKKEESTTTNDGERVFPKTTPLIEVAEQVAERLERANQQTQENLNRLELIESRRALGGGSEAGQSTQKVPEISPKDYAKEILSGKHNAKE